jgi:hypothetical protein
MKTSMNFIPLLLALLAYFSSLHTASAFYDPSTQRWINRDPVGELGFETLHGNNYYHLGMGELSQGANIYQALHNSAVNNLDYLGLTIYVCTRQVTGWEKYGSLGMGQHSYYYNDQNGKTCGTQGSSGYGDPNRQEQGPLPRPDGSPGDSCAPVDGSEGKEQSVMDCCGKHADDGLYVPWINDCHSAAENCLHKNGLSSPSHHRFKPSKIFHF